MKLLLTTPLIGVPPIGGPELRVANSIKALSAISELHVFPRCSVDASTMHFLRTTCKSVVSGPPSSEYLFGKSLPARAFRRVLTGLIPTTFSSIVSKVDVQKQTSAIVRYAEDHQLHAVWFSYGCISYPLMQNVKRVAPTLRLVCDTDSVWSQFVARGLPFEASGRRRKAIIRRTRSKIAEEQQWVQFCNVTTAVCDADAEYYRSLAADPSAISIFRNAIDVSTYDVVVSPPADHKQPSLVMMGSYYSRESPMAVSARWVVSEILPRVRAAIPGVHLYIVGNGSDKFVKDLESDSVTVTGKVESTLPYLKHANVALAPLLFEAAGAKYKVLEAAICEIPIVATPVGAEGLPNGYCKYLRVCTGAEEFVSGILDAIRKDAGAAAHLHEFRNHVERNFGLQQLSAEGAEILRRLYAK